MCVFRCCLAISFLIATVSAQQVQPNPGVAVQVSAERLFAHIRILASDEFEGRGPGSHGEDKTVEYLIAQFRKAKLLPGNPDGTYIQSVPLTVLNSHGSIRFHSAKEDYSLSENEALVYSLRVSPLVEFNHLPVVFAGYGVSDPAAGWDDYKGLDVRGKLVLVLQNDVRADAHDPEHAQPHVPALQRHYYTNIHVKIAEAERRRAAAVLLIAPPAQSDAAWNGQVSRSQELFRLSSESPALVMQGFVRRVGLDRVLTGTDWSYEKLVKAAGGPDFHGLQLDVVVSAKADTTSRQVTSRNVVALLPGADAKLAREYIVYSAHWDAFGMDPKRTGDKIYHGALDDAGGVAQLLEIARVFRSAFPQPRRSVLFLVTTGEERGLLGSNHYVKEPLYALKSTIAVINLDALQPFGRTSDLESVGGQSSLDRDLGALAKAGGRVFAVTNSPLFYSSDQAPFAIAGVPAIFVASGDTDLKGTTMIQEKLAEAGKCIHQPCDVPHDDWDLTGSAEDTQLWFRLGYMVAQGSTEPGWNDDSLWKPVREKMLKTH
jgi:hypothetical protein